VVEIPSNTRFRSPFTAWHTSPAHRSRGGAVLLLSRSALTMYFCSLTSFNFSRQGYATSRLLVQKMFSILVFQSRGHRRGRTQVRFSRPRLSYKRSSRLLSSSDSSTTALAKTESATAPKTNTHPACCRTGAALQQPAESREQYFRIRLLILLGQRQQHDFLKHQAQHHEFRGSEKGAGTRRAAGRSRLRHNCAKLRGVITGACGLGCDYVSTMGASR